jgi:hypothetical protein
MPAFAIASAHSRNSGAKPLSFAPIVGSPVPMTQRSPLSAPSSILPALSMRVSQR